MPLQSAHVFASHIGHTGKTTLAFQMSCYYAKRHPELTVLVMDLAEEGDLTKRFLGGVDAARPKIDELCGGVFQLLDDAASKRSFLTGWLWADTFDITKHAIKVTEHNPGIPQNLLLIASGAWPRDEKPMDKKDRAQICARLTEALEKSDTTWKLFCDSDGDRRPSPFTLIGYGLCSQAIIPLHLNKGDLDRTETMLAMMQQYRESGETKAQVLFIVWNFVKSLKDEPFSHEGSMLSFTPTKVNLDIWKSCNKRLYDLSLKLPNLFVHGEASEDEFTRSSTTLLRQLADNVLKPSEELGLPFVEMIDKLNASGKKSMKFKSGDVEYVAQDSTLMGVDEAMRSIEAKFEAMSLTGGPAAAG